jgi:hypothetical protein
MCLPPLNADFFTQLQRIATAKHDAAIDGVIEDVLSLYGTDFSLTLEGYFTQLEAMLATVKKRSAPAGGISQARLEAMRSRLLDALSAVLEESADVAKRNSPGQLHPCRYHAELVAALRPKDTLISFNYDCVIDHALRTGGTGKWSARYGYGFPSPSRVTGTAAWDAASAPKAQNESVNLLKLHGSLNWFPFPKKNSDTIRLREKPYKQKGDKRYEIVPPEYVKTVESRPIYPTLWAHAELAIRRATTCTFVGFSFTPTDLHVEALFRLALAGNGQLSRLVIVTPSQEHRRRIRQIASPALKNGARVIQFDTFAEGAPHLAKLLA